jgi:hypothetical protein
VKDASLKLLAGEQSASWALIEWTSMVGVWRDCAKDQKTEAARMRACPVCVLRHLEAVSLPRFTSGQRDPPGGKNRKTLSGRWETLVFSQLPTRPYFFPWAAEG